MRKEGFCMEKLLNILKELHPDVDFTTQEGLVDNAILDSMDIVSLIAAIKDVYDVSITARDIVPENFNSAAALYQLIERLCDED